MEGQPLTNSPVTTIPLTLINERQEKIQFFITSHLTPPIILRHLGLLQHDPLIA